MLEHLTISELQRRGASGDTEALTELGRRVLDIDFDCQEHGRYCPHLEELNKIADELNQHLPPDCPHCGKFLTNN